MQRVKNQQYLYRQPSGTYWFRRAIPKDVRSAFDGRREVQVSLRTCDLGVARHRMADHLKAFDIRLLRARGSQFEVIDGGPDPADLATAVREWLRERLQSNAPSFGKVRDNPDGPEGREGDLLDFERDVSRALKEGSQPPQLTVWTAEGICTKRGWNIDRQSPLWLELCNLVARAEIEFARQARDQLDDREGAIHNKALFGAAAYADDAERSKAPPLTLKQAVDTFLAEPSLQASDKTRKKYRANFDMLIEWFGAARPIASITRGECRTFRDEVVCKLPRHRFQKLGDIPLRDALQLADLNEMDRIHAKTQNLIIDNVQGVFEWAVKEGARPDNPAKHLRIRVNRKKKARLPFDAAHLQNIFSAPLYTGCKNDQEGYAKPGSARPRGHRFWLPLIGLFTGMRLNEICQLRTESVTQREGIWTFVIQESDEDGVTLKTDASERFVPVHPTLIKIGFIDHVRGRAGKKWLFDLNREGRHNGSDPVSKWFARFLDKVGLNKPGLVFHSFRHTFRDALRQCGVDPERSLALGGWSDSLVGNQYGRGHGVRSLFEALSRVSYPELDLSHLMPSERGSAGVSLREPEILQPIATAAE
jgi:integrase